MFVDVLSSSEIKEILKKWTELQIFVEKTHPDREKANRCIRQCHVIQQKSVEEKTDNLRPVFSSENVETL